VKRWILAAALCVLAVPDSQAGALYVQVGASFTFQNNLSYNADAWYDYDFFDLHTANVWGAATLNGSGQPSQYFGPIPGHLDIASGSWTFSGTYGSCYQVYATATEDINGTTQGAGSSLQCAYWQPPAYTLALWANMGGALYRLRDERFQAGAWLTLSPDTPHNWRFTGWSGYMNSQTETISFNMPAHDIEVTGNYTYEPPPPGDEIPQCGGGPYEDCSPIVINFEGEYELTGADAPVWFDINAIGTPVLIGWTAAGSDEAFLWLDRNGNGTVDDGAELFGTATRLANGDLAANGFEALLEIDSNDDSMIDSRDDVWPALRLWRDMNHNGVSEPGETSMLAGSEVTGISLDYREVRRRDRHGNEFRFQSHVWLRGNSGRSVVRPVYDIFFVRVAQ
jgi:hypothetical protein